MFIVSFLSKSKYIRNLFGIIIDAHGLREQKKNSTNNLGFHIDLSLRGYVGSRF